jgi:hypothetical protein
MQCRQVDSQYFASSDDEPMNYEGLRKLKYAVLGRFLSLPLVVSTRLEWTEAELLQLRL